MSMDQVTEKPKRTLSPELKERMRQGRLRAAQNRKATKAKPVLVRRKDAPELAPAQQRKLVVQNATSVPDAPKEFLGLTETDCPVECNAKRCAIGGSLHFNNPDGTKTLEGRCSHPRKGGLAPIQKMNGEIVERFNLAVKHLEHLKIEQKNR